MGHYHNRYIRLNHWSMAVTADELSSLDLTIWLKSQSKASSFLKSSQPVISRNIKKVVDIFNLNYFRSNGEFIIESDAAMRRLNIERCLHQELRFHDPNAILRFDAFPKVKTNLTTKEYATHGKQQTL